MKQMLLSVCLTAVAATFSPAEAPRPKRPPPPSSIIYALDPKPGEKNIVNLAVEWLKPKKNGIAILISDGCNDEITGKVIAEHFIKWFWYDWGLEVRCFVDAPPSLRYSGVSFIVGDIPYGPWNIVEARDRIPDIVAAFHANIEIRIDEEESKKSNSTEAASEKTGL